MSPAAFKSLALSFPEAEEKPHFEKVSFRVKKKIFATLDLQQNQVVLKLNLVDQSVFSDSGPGVYPVANKWGKQGWTHFDLSSVHQDLLKDALNCAYKTVAPQKLSNLI